MDNMNQPAPQGAPVTPVQMPEQKKGYGGVVTIIVLLLLILAAYLLLPEAKVPVQPATTAQQPTTQAQDLNSLQTELDATNFDGVSSSL